MIGYRQGQLLDMVAALEPPGRFASGLNRRDQQRNERANDRNDHQQFDQREPNESTLRVPRLASFGVTHRIAASRNDEYL